MQAVKQQPFPCLVTVSPRFIYSNKKQCLVGIPHSVAPNTIPQYQAYYGLRNIRVYLSFKLYMQSTWKLSESLLLQYHLIRWLLILLVFHFFQYENDNVGRAYRL